MTSFSFARVSFDYLLRLVDFRPFPGFVHLAVYRNAHDCSSNGISCLECLIGRERHDHQDDKNWNDEGWNKPSFHYACPSLSCGVSRLRTRQRPARRFTLFSWAGVSRVATRSYPDRAWSRYMPRELAVANRNQTHAFT
jgi:hypothetical protein